MSEKKTEALERIAKGETPTEVSRALGVSKVTVHAWKKEGGLTASPPPRDVEIELLKLEVVYWKARADVLQRALTEGA